MKNIQAIYGGYLKPFLYEYSNNVGGSGGSGIETSCTTWSLIADSAKTWGGLILQLPETYTGHNLSPAS